MHLKVNFTELLNCYAQAKQKQKSEILRKITVATLNVTMCTACLGANLTGLEESTVSFYNLSQKDNTKN
jgi:hypothetical protein